MDGPTTGGAYKRGAYNWNFTVPLISFPAKLSDFYTLSQTKLLENCTLHSGTFLYYSSCMVVPPPPDLYICLDEVPRLRIAYIYKKINSFSRKKEGEEYMKLFSTHFSFSCGHKITRKCLMQIVHRMWPGKL